MRGRTTAVWEQLRPSQISSRAALLALLHSFGATTSAARLRLPSSSAILPTRTGRYFAGQSKIARTASVASRADTAFALLLGRKCYMVSLRVTWLNSLPGSECRCWMNLFQVLSVILNHLPLGGHNSSTLSLKSLPVNRNNFFSSRTTIFWKSTRLLGRRPFISMHQHPLQLVLPCLSGLDYDYSYLLLLPCR